MVTYLHVTSGQTQVNSKFSSEIILGDSESISNAAFKNVFTFSLAHQVFEISPFLYFPINPIRAFDNVQFTVVIIRNITVFTSSLL